MANARLKPRSWSSITMAKTTKQSEASPMRAALYARFSTDLQRDASIEDQLRVGREFAARAGHEVVEVYADRAASGASLMRSGLQALLRDARAGRFDVVVAEALDRLSRSQADIAGLHERLGFLGIGLETVAEGAITEMHIGLKGTMNALFLKDLAQKTHRGLEGRVREGKSAGGRAYGYRSVVRFAADGTPVRGDLVVDETEAAVIRRVFRDYAQGVSPRTIAARLNQERVPGPRGRAWGSSTLYGNPKRGTGLLNNELYIGRRVWNRQRFVKDPETGKRQARPNEEAALVVQEAPELRLIDQELWEAVKRRQASLVVEGPEQKPWDRRRPRYLFSGLAICGVCGSGYSIVSPGRLGCSAARNKGETVCSNHATIARADLEGRVLHALSEHLMDPELVRVFCEEFTAEMNRLRAEAGTQRASKAAELERVKRDHGKLVDAIVAGVPAVQVKDRMIALDTRRQELEAELSASPAPEPVRFHPGMAEVYRQKVYALVEGLTDPERNLEVSQAIRALVDRIVLTPELRPGRKRATLTVDLEGALAAILHLANGSSAKTSANAQKPASLGEAGVQESMAKLVAGAGFEPAAFRL